MSDDCAEQNQAARVVLPGQRDFMDNVIDYRRHAAECRRLALTSRSEDHREMLLGITESWETMALDRERALGRK